MDARGVSTEITSPDAGLGADIYHAAPVVLSDPDDNVVLESVPESRCRRFDAPGCRIGIDNLRGKLRIFRFSVTSIL